MSAERDILMRYRLERAREILVEAELMAQTGHWNGCVNRLYYALSMRKPSRCAASTSAACPPWLPPRIACMS